MPCALRPVVGQVGQVLEAGDVVPGAGVEDLRHSVDRTHGRNRSVRHPSSPTRPLESGRGVVLWPGMALTGEYVPSPTSGSATGRGVRGVRRRAGQHPARHRLPDRGDHLGRRAVRQAAQEPRDARRARRRLPRGGVQGRGADDPVWADNFRPHPEVDLQDRPEPHTYRVRELLDGDERDEWWERAVATWPTYASYQKKTDRLIPVFLLERRPETRHEAPLRLPTHEPVTTRRAGAAIGASTSRPTTPPVRWRWSPRAGQPRHHGRLVRPDPGAARRAGRGTIATEAAAKQGGAARSSWARGRWCR